MLQEFWDYFMTTGQVDMYLNYKAYEKEISYQLPKDEMR